jgi:hypothetical protein
MENIPENPEQLLKLLQDAAIRAGDAGHRFRLDNGQLARVKFERNAKSDNKDEYARARVTLVPPPIEQGVVAALVALRGKHVEAKELRGRHVERALLGAHWLEQVREAHAKDEPPPDELPDADNVKLDEALDGFGYLYAEELLRHYRADFDKMPRWDQAALVKRVLEKVNEYLDALRQLMLCVQHGHHFEGLPNTPVKKAERDMRAAELRDIDELSYVEIGKRLGVGQTPSDKRRRDNTQVRLKIVRRGREHFRQALGGKEKYKQYVKSSQAEIARRQSLDEVGRYTEDFAEATKIPVETMQRIMTATRDDLAAWMQTLDRENPDDRQVFLAIMFGRAWYEFFNSR